jgi:predicted dehydrogenase
MPAEINVASIGLGHMGRAHAANLAKLPGVRLVALCDINPQALTQCKAEVGDAAGAAYGATDADPIFADPNVDAVVIATQHDTHTPLAIAAAQAKKHLLVEKPLALTEEECRAIEQAVNEAGVQLVMGFQARHRHFVQMIKHRIPAPRVVVGEIIDPKWPDDYWAVDPIKGGGNVLSQGVHTFDLVCYLAGSEPASIHAVGGIFSHDPAVTSTIDTCLATIQFKNGAVGATVIGDFGQLPWPGDKAFYQVFDARNHSATMYGTRVLFASGDVQSKPEVEEYIVEDSPVGEQPDYTGRRNLAVEFVDCVRENRPPIIAANVQEGRRATVLALRAFEAMRTGLPQPVD